MKANLVRSSRRAALTLGVVGAVLGSAALVLGCETTTVSVIGPPREPRPANCQLVLAGPGDVLPGGRFADAYEPIGSVHVVGDYGVSAADPAVKAKLRPRACGLGGELVVPTGSWGLEGRYGNHIGQNISYRVYAKKSAEEPRPL